MPRPDSKSYKVMIFEDAPCSSWDLVSSAQYIPPESSGPWSRIILDVSFTENGTQFDRYGALWLGGVELLRTTTAEPTADGIFWFIEKDVTLYSDYFKQESIARLSIPNNIDDTYTGIPLATVSLTFFEADPANPGMLGAPTLFPVSNNPASWEDLAVSAGSNLSYSVTLPYDDVIAVQLDLMASPHGCEEFWYTNVDDDNAAAKFGLCGGGVYRELQVYVDGVLAGATYPFPVMYTGGINPFLWRPLTGIMSFDIPAYEFDLTPFVLGDGGSHDIVLKVLGGDDEGGVWYLDATLLLFRDASSAPVSGSLKDHSDSAGDVQSSSSASVGGYSWNTSGTHSFAVQGEILMGGRQGRSVTATVTGKLSSWNTNHIGDPATKQDTAGVLSAVHSNALGDVLADVGHVGPDFHGSSAVRTNSLEYPYTISSTYAQDETSMDMVATVNMSYDRSSTFAYSTALASRSFAVHWANSISSDAAYNRSLDHTTVYVESDAAAAQYHISSSQDNNGECYLREAVADAGYVTQDRQQGQCELPEGKYICGYVLCSGNPRSSEELTVKANTVRATERQSKHPSSPTARVGGGYDVPMRHPLMGRAKLAVPRGSGKFSN